jgi:hypothetical protein
MSGRIYAHGIGGGWDLRHEGCAPRCCEVAADVVRGPVPNEVCGGCEGELREPPRPMSFDRSEPCEEHESFEEHRARDPHFTCPDCMGAFIAQQELAIAQVGCCAACSPEAA